MIQIKYNESRSVLKKRRTVLFLIIFADKIRFSRMNFQNVQKNGTERQPPRNAVGTCMCYNFINGQRTARPKKTFIGGIFIMLFETIAKVIAERTDRDVAEIKPESTFAELGIDSLDTVELLMNLEDEIGMEIELDQKVETVDDLVKFIESKKG